MPSSQFPSTGVCFQASSPSCVVQCTSSKRFVGFVTSFHVKMKRHVELLTHCNFLKEICNSFFGSFVRPCEHYILPR